MPRGYKARVELGLIPAVGERWSEYDRHAEVLGQQDLPSVTGHGFELPGGSNRATFNLGDGCRRVLPHNRAR